MRKILFKFCNWYETAVYISVTEAGYPYSSFVLATLFPFYLIIRLVDLRGGGLDMRKFCKFIKSADSDFLIPLGFLVLPIWYKIAGYLVEYFSK